MLDIGWNTQISNSLLTKAVIAFEYGNSDIGPIEGCALHLGIAGYLVFIIKCININIPGLMYLALKKIHLVTTLFGHITFFRQCAASIYRNVCPYVRPLVRIRKK